MSKLRPHLKRRACDPESGSPKSYGFDLSSVDEFRADAKVAFVVKGAATPSGYFHLFINLRGASSAFDYIRYKVVSSYDPAECASESRFQGRASWFQHL